MESNDRAWQFVFQFGWRRCRRPARTDGTFLFVGLERVPTTRVVCERRGGSTIWKALGYLRHRQATVSWLLGRRLEDPTEPLSSSPFDNVGSLIAATRLVAPTAPAEPLHPNRKGNWTRPERLRNWHRSLVWHELYDAPNADGIARLRTGFAVHIAESLHRSPRPIAPTQRGRAEIQNQLLTGIPDRLAAARLGLVRARTRPKSGVPSPDRD